MPIFKAAGKLVYYAHVPKCGGSALAWYLRERFGLIAFSDDRYFSQPARRRWTRTSPQHVDREALGRLFPDGFFDASFTVVRHPVSRLVSAYHFQMEVEKTVPDQTGFSDWLADLEDRLAEDPFVFDNHVRPMDQIVPEGAQVFHLEHGIDALVPWFDTLTGGADSLRAIPRINEKSGGPKAARVTPGAPDLELIGRLYAVDFKRFGYDLERRDPAAPAPRIAPEQVAARDALERQLRSPVRRLRRRSGRALKA